jgi:DinB superfamily
VIAEVAPAAALLSTTPECLRALFDALPDDLLRRQPRAGEWSALQCLEHVAETETEVFARRFAAFLAGDAEFPAYEPAPAGEGDARTLLDGFAEARRRNLETLDAMTEADLDRVSRHAKLGEISLRTQVLEWAAHDTNHVIQAERAVMQPFIAGSGPWRSSFAEHDQAQG